MTEIESGQTTEKPSETGSTVGLIVAIVVLAALVGMLLLVRGPQDQDHARIPGSVAAIMLRA
jgi:hypothetical protein